MASEDWPLANAWSLHGNKDIVSRYEILERIGEGTYGEVHRARRRSDNLTVALKEIHNSESSSREVTALLLLDHPNVVKLHEYFAQGSNMVLVLEYLPYNLAEVIRAGKGKLSDGEVKGWMVQILQGLAACHAASVLHRDLKPNNLLISEDRTLKIADFGQARVLSDSFSVNVEGELCGSGIHENYVTGTESHSVRGAPSLGYRTDMECEVGEVDPSRNHSAGFPFKSGKVEATRDYFGAGRGHSTKATGEKRVTEPGTKALKDNGDRHGMDLGSGPTNVGFSALADAVKDARNYFTIEEMVRSGTGMEELGLSGLQRQGIIGSHSEDPGCCGWFPMESVENQPPALTVQQKPSSEPKITKNVDTVSSVGRDHQVREREEDSSSGDESDVDWKGKYGVKSEDLIDTLKRTEETRKTGLSSSAANTGGDGDFLQKLRRFIRKRTRRLNSEGKVAGGSGHSRHEKASAGARGNNFKGATQRDGHLPQHMHRSCPGSRKNASSERIPGNAKPGPSASETMVSSLDQQVHSQAQMRRGVRSFHLKEWKSLESEPSNDGEVRLESMDEVAAVSGHDNEQSSPRSPLNEGALDFSVPGRLEDDVMDGEEEDGTLRTESGRKLYGGLQVEKVDDKTRSKAAVNGPLREMAHARVHESGDTAAQGDDRELSSEVEAGCGQISSMGLKNSNGDQIHGMREGEKESESEKVRERENENNNGEGCNGGPQSDQKAANVSPGEEVLGANESSIPSWNGMGWKDVDGVAETIGDGIWGGRSLGEPINGRDGCKSWMQTEGYSSTLSDAEAEGTRWYGAPQFQYSYMDSKTGGKTGGKTGNGTSGRAIGGEGYWEEDGTTTDHISNGDYSAEDDSIGRDGDSESENGSDFTTMVGTRWYKAPELLYGATKYGLGIDIWAVGCIFGELLWGKPLFPGLNDIDQLSRVVRVMGSPNEKVWTGVSLLPDFNKINFIDERFPVTLKNYVPNISEDALDFLQKLLAYDPVVRLGAENAVEDVFFSKQPLPWPCHELPLPAKEDSEASDEDWGTWKDPGSPFSDFEILG